MGEIVTNGVLAPPAKKKKKKKKELSLPKAEPSCPSIPTVFS